MKADLSPAQRGASEGLARRKSSLIPVTRADLNPIVREHGTPFHLYDEGGIRASAQRLMGAFSWVQGPKGESFGNYFAVKATPPPAILEVVRSEGMGADCSSPAELSLAKIAKFPGSDIMYTSNNTHPREFGEAYRLGATLNVDDISHIPDVLDQVGVPDVICFRYNPGPAREGNSIIGNPEDAKFGMTKEQLFQAYDIMHGKGVRSFGLHTMVASNELNPQYFVDTAKMLFGVVGELHARGITIDFVNLGGGIGIPYRPEEEPVNIDAVSAGIRQAYKEMIVSQGLDPLRIVMENGRLITGPNGILVTSVIHNNTKHKRFVGLDASIPDLLRAGIYDTSYHHATLLGQEDMPSAGVASLTGRLCEGNDIFVSLPFPETEKGDIVVFQDTGAHGSAMGNNYNGYLRAPGFLMHPDGSHTMVQRAQTLNDYLGQFVY